MRDKAVAKKFRKGPLAATVVYMVLALAWGVSLMLIQHNSDADRERGQKTAYQACLDRRAGRETFREVILIAVPDNGPVDYSRFPSYQDLDPAMRGFLQELAQAQNTRSGPTGLRDRLLAKVPPIECVPPE